MRHLVDQRFLSELSTFKLRHTCGDCVHFEVDAGTCAEGYPNDEHLHTPQSVGEQVCFCKSFELFG
jgi:hypothetical protein